MIAMRSMLRAALVAALSCLAACESGRPLDSNPVVQGPLPGSSSADMAAPSGGGSPVRGDPSKTITVEADADADAAAPAVAPPETDAVPPGVTPPKAADAAAPVVTPPKAADASAPVVAEPAADASALDVTSAEAGAPLTCASLAAGGTPNRLQDFQWQYQVAYVGPYNAPYDTVTIANGCVLTYQRTIMPPAPKSTTQMVTMNTADCADARGWATNARFLEVLRTGDHCPTGDGNPGDVFDLTLTDEGRVARKTFLCPEPTLEAVRACLRPLVARLFPK
jgi:hypothetical protein